MQGDVSNLADLDRLFGTVKQQQGRLDVLFANAGVLAVAPLGLITEEDFANVFNVNVEGLLFTGQMGRLPASVQFTNEKRSGTRDWHLTPEIRHQRYSRPKPCKVAWCGCGV